MAIAIFSPRFVAALPESAPVAGRDRGAQCSVGREAVNHVTHIHVECLRRCARGFRCRFAAGRGSPHRCALLDPRPPHSRRLWNHILQRGPAMNTDRDTLPANLDPLRSNAYRDIARLLAEALAAGMIVSLVLALAIFIVATRAQAAETGAAPGQGTLLMKSAPDAAPLAAPLLLTDVHIDVSGLVAGATVAQRFVNATTVWQEGIYVFPLPENAAVDHLAMQIGERWIEGQIHERTEARAAYEQRRPKGARRRSSSRNGRTYSRRRSRTSAPARKSSSRSNTSSPSATTLARRAVDRGGVLRHRRHVHRRRGPAAREGAARPGAAASRVDADPGDRRRREALAVGGHGAGCAAHRAGARRRSARARRRDRPHARLRPGPPRRHCAARRAGQHGDLGAPRHALSFPADARAATR